MSNYILRRIGLAIVTFFGITVLVFMISSMASGSPLELLLSNQNISPAEVERQRIKLGLDQPVYIQYFSWLKNFLQGNLGESYRTGQPVMKMIMDGLGPTLLLTLSAVIVSCLISLPLGIQSARFQNKGWDNSSSVFSFLATSTPSFFLALIFLYLFAVKLKWLPIGGMYDSGKPETPASLLRHLLMPAVVLGMQMVGSLIQYTRSSMLEVMREDYGTQGACGYYKACSEKFPDTRCHLFGNGDSAFNRRSGCNGTGVFVAGNRKPDDKIHRQPGLSGSNGDHGSCCGRRSDI